MEELDNEPTVENSAKLSTHLPVEKPLEMTPYHLKSSSTGNVLYCCTCMYVSASAGKRSGSSGHAQCDDSKLVQKQR